jgi:hypothetical protein
MRRLAHLPQRVIGCIDRIADWPLTEQLQAMRNFVRRRLDPRSVYNPRREAWTELRLFYLDGKLGVTFGWRQVWINWFQREAINRGRLSRHTVMVHRVGPIRANLHFENSVRSRADNSLHRNSRRRQVVSQPPIIDGNIDKLTDPLWRYFHKSAVSS